MRTPIAGLWLLAFATCTVAAPVRSAEPVDYETQIKPILEHRCTACHGALRKQGGLRLDAIQFLREGGDSGFTLVPEEPSLSMLVAALKGDDGVPQMPKDAPPLPAEEIALIERWIAEGAAAPQEEPVEGDPEAHWSFRPVRRPAVPDVAGAGNAIDAFISARRDAEMETLGPAPRHVLLRRIYLDLVGVPPTPAELHSFLEDDSPGAYEQVVHRLLADPRHGERWGRHWMDVWRYSDWYGYRAELRNSQKHIWHWRDWIVESLNTNKPYDRMILEMLAADEVAPTDEAALRATGFLARNYYKFNRDVWLDRTVEHTGKAFLGLTFNCARCHDHMFDPITQREYFAMRAFFEPHNVRLDPIDGVLDENKDGLPRVYDADATTLTYLYVRGNDKQPDKENPVAAALPAFFVDDAPPIEPITLPAVAYYPGFRPEVRNTLLQQAGSELAAAQSAVAKASAEVSAEADTSVTSASVAEARLRAARLKLDALQARIAADDVRYRQNEPGESTSEIDADLATLSTTAARAERSAALAAAQTDELAKQLALIEAESKPEAERAKAVAAAKKALEAAAKNVETARKASEATDDKYSPLTPVYPATSTGRRTALANWITDPANPLTARVAVNHIWSRHFGEPLVESTFDFGMHGTPPTHPQLLDWLARELIESGWNMKHLHRLIVTSDVYRLDSTAGAGHPSLDVDPDNHLLWRMNARRAEGEVVRDSLLAISGRLDGTLGGAELSADEEQTTTRRSLYYRHAPEKYSAFLKLFDAPNADECYRRAETIVPQQALAQMNSRLSREQSRVIARDLMQRGGETDSELIEAAFERLLCRPATSQEREACASFLTAQESRLTSPDALTGIENGPEIGVVAPDSPRDRAFASLIHVLINHHDFVTIR